MAIVTDHPVPKMRIPFRARTRLLFTRLFFSIPTTLDLPATAPYQCPLTAHYFSLLHSSPNLLHLRHLHARLLRTSLYADVVLTSKLVLVYSRHGKLTPDSLSVFFHMPTRNIYSWNIIIGEFSRSNQPEKAGDLFLRMWRGTPLRPDDFTLPLVLRACGGSGSMVFGVSLHGLCVKLGWDVSLFVGSALVFMYVTFGSVSQARVMFDEMPRRDGVLWTAMLAGYAQHGEPMLGMEVFREMVRVGVRVDGVVMVSLLSVCGQLGWLKHGKSVHGWCVRNHCPGFELSLGNAIIDMYVKCATLRYAHKIFTGMPETDVFSWSSLILGYGLSGNVSAALGLFDEMLKTEVKPNDVTFLGVLSACAHGGLVERARPSFKMMQDYGVVAQLKHYASMVDCLGRAGLLEEAELFVEEMPVEPDAAVLGAILAGCRLHNNLEVGERIAEKLIRLEPEKAGYYILLSNIYAAVGRFDEAEAVRDFMREKSVSKVPGSSLIESKTTFPP